MPSPPSQLLDALRHAGRISFLTGAGMSAESGVPTFRDAQTGLWSRYSPEELATPQAFERDPVTVWKWYRWRRELVSRAQCHAGHRAIAGFEQRHPSVSIITQNVDGLHQKAGSTNVVEFHGSLLRDRCHDCGNEMPASEALEPPRCEKCGGMMRPAVVWFGETIPSRALADADTACNTELLLIVGTAGAVHPAAGLAELAAQRGAKIAVINTEATAIDHLADWQWRASASAMPSLLDQA
ncbi:MAG: NAD-dependent deacylase [Gammaproteobacteria bacterium]|nr:NAD-dependent deacylase [Gammaproteobacteria bacterium]